MATKTEEDRIAFQNATKALSEASRPTLEKMYKRRRRQWSTEKRTKCTIYDNTNSQYGWLLPGWLVEERRMISGRLYRYYYDPLGQMYQTQHEVLAAFEDSGVIVLDM